MSQTVTVGYAARLPHAGDARAVWDVLREGRSTVSQIPQDRWSSLKFLDPTGTLAGHSHTRAAGVLDDPWGFDPAAFGISPREAAQMDPQQRLLLELSAEAFDHAGINPQRLDRNRTGVFIGASAADHSTIGLQDPTLIESHYMLGNTLSILANRISYQWDLHGPSMTVDTACSSGLVAFDLARKAIEAEEIDTAVVGGVSLLLSPVAFIGFSNAGMLSRQGRCAAFGAGADGYVRAEGGVVFILSRLETARASGLRLRSVVAGSGVNTAGYTRGITIPSESRQADLIRAVMDAAGIDPEDLAFAEAHGTGTPVGDPREAGALGETYGRRRRTPLPIGSAKSNFGHLEPASGLVGVLKAQLALEHHFLPATLHADPPNPDIDFAALNLEVMTQARPMPPHARPWAVSVNSFGFGGANAHVVIREPDPAEQTPEEEDPALPPSLLMTGQSETALIAVAQDWQRRLAEPVGAAQLATLIANANHNLARRAHRLCLAAGSRAVLCDQIDRWIAGDHPDRAGFRARGDDLPVAFVFSGNGALWDGMARQNYLKDAAFRKAFAEIAALVAQAGGPDLITLLMTPQDEAAMRPAGIAQPLHFAIQVALVDSLAAAGVRPAAVMGHSLGEVAASVIAGRISRREGVHIILSRSAAFAPLEDTGGMAALSGARQAVSGLIAQLGLPIDISAENAPASVTVSGTQADLAALLKAARRAKIAGKMLPVAYPYHGRAVAALESRLRADLACLVPQPGTIPFYSGALGRRADGVPSDAGYWWANARNAVEFRAAAAAMVADGYRIFLEISPRSVMRGYLTEVIAQSGEPAVVIEGLDRSHPDLRLASDIARRVLAAGGAVEELRLLGPRRPMGSTPPHAAFERQTFRLATAQGPDIFGRAPAHPLLGARTEAGGTIWRNDLSLALLPWLGDHRVGGRVLLPATGMAEIFLAAAADIEAGVQDQTAPGTAVPGPCEIADLDIFHPVVIPEQGAAPIRVIHDRAARRLTLETGGDGQWQTVATARLFTAVPTHLPPETGCATAPLPGLYDGLRRAGLDYGPAFARLAGLSPLADGAFAELSPAPPPGDFLLDPTAFDAALHAVAALPAFAEAAAGTGPMVPGRMGRLRWFGGGRIRRARLHLRSSGEESACLDLTLYGDDGGPVALIEEIRLRRMPLTQGPETLYWDEIALPLAGERRVAPTVLSALLDRFGAGEETAGDADVLRAAIAARLAWDIACSDDAAIPDARRRFSRTWLEAAGYLTPDGLAGDCPWPPVGDLIPMFGALPEDVQDDLQASLSLAAGREPKPETGARASARLIAMLDTLPGACAGRVLIAGRADAALIAAAARIGGGYVTLAAADADEAAALRPHIAEAGTAVALLPLDDETQDAQVFDLVLGAHVSNGTIAPRLLARRVAPGGGALFAEETPDLFACLCGRHGDGAAIERLQAAFAAAGIALSAYAARGSEAVTLLQGVRDATETADAPEGGLAAAMGDIPFRLLPKAPKGETAPARAIRHAAAFRDLPEGDRPFWIIALSADESAALFALRRVVANESGRDLRVLALTPALRASQQHLARRIAGLVRAPECEIVADDRQGTPAASPRIVAMPPPQPPAPAGEGTLLRLSARRRSPVLDGLYWQRLPRPAPARQEVEIEIEASALNFRDVMWGQGLIPPEALEGGFAGQGFGMECAGRVLRCGADVPPHLAPGTSVIAFAPHAFGSHVTVPAHAVMPRDPHMPAEIAAAAPVVFLTADYALNELAHLAADETILIHGAAGGVGIAAIQIAQRIGARIIATAGSAEKRLWLRMIGVGTVLDSRAGDFADRVMAETGGHGVDVVLNALAGEGLERGLSCLGPFGRFVELGKRDIYENNLIALRAFRNNISLLAVDADQLLAYRPQVAARIMARVGKGLAEGALTPPPVRIMAAAAVTDAFRLMQRSGHIGKIVVRAPRPCARAPARRADLSGNWLVTGGTGGFGYRAALWLKRQGADRVWLTSRTGRLTEGTPPEGFTLRPADATDAAAMRDVLDEIAAAGGLSGVIHSAAVLDDALFAALDPARIGRVAGAKAGGAALLDQLTRALPLRHFWCFSSVAVRFGNPGQAAYAAANAETEALMRRRRQAGLPGLAIAWGPISDTGMLARDAALRETLTTQLGRLLTAEEALQAFGDWLADAPEGAATVTIAPLRWGRLAGDLPVLSGPLFDAIDTDAARAAGSVDLGALVAAGKEGEARRIALETVLAESAQILRSTPAAIDPQRPLTDLGLDSLMAMNLKLAIEERFGLDIPARALAGEPSPARLVQSLFDTISSGSAGAQGAVLVEAHLSETILTEDVRADIMARTRAPSASMEARRT